MLLEISSKNPVISEWSSYIMDNKLSLCRCCLDEGLHKDLKIPYSFLDRKEIYADMLLECFNIVIMPSQCITSSICDTCVAALRTALSFKSQVLAAEQELLQRAKEGVLPGMKDIEIKLEPKHDSEFSDSDDYFLADTVKEVSEDKVKLEKEPVRRKAKPRALKPQPEKWGQGKMPNIRARLAPNINSCELTIQRKPSRKLTRKITIKSEPPKINLSWTPPTDKYKLKDNLISILRYSNVLPFKNKSLLGYICAYCDIAYPDPVNLRSHTEQDHKKERLKLKFKKALSENSIKLDITNLKCTLCDENIENLTLLREHLIKTHEKIIHTDVKDLMMQFKLKKGEVYDCAMCSSTYETFKTLKQHMNIHYSNYSCNKCEAVFVTKRSLGAHLNTHQDGAHKCDYCEKVFSSRAKKHYHHKIKHLGTRNISNCPYCDEPFRSYYQRNQHLVKVHNTESQYKCNVCNKQFILKSLLMYHIKKSHLMERNAQCTECGYRFFSKKALKAHMVKHTGERNYCCEVCHKSYARKYTLREHMRIHNNDRRFKCDVCGMTFVQKCSLKSHLLSNHGISLAACEITTT